MRILPLGQISSQSALESFVQGNHHTEASPQEVEAILLRILSVLDKHVANRIPTLVDRYLASRTATADALVRFSQCVEDVLRFHSIRDGAVQDAIFFINTRYSESRCNPQSIAESLGLRLSSLDVIFKRDTGFTLTEFIRETRLQQAAVMLVTTNKTIKEVWASVGYGHHSNFDHDFKRRFQTTPREYRSRAIRPVARHLSAVRRMAPVGMTTAATNSRGVNLLIVDDDETTRMNLTAWLRKEGHSVTAVDTGRDALGVFADTRPDVVLLDYHLGDMDGIDVLRGIRELADVTESRVALFTADWELYDRSDEVARFDGMIASKLCDLDQVSDLVLYLRGLPDSNVPEGLPSPAWKRWMPFA